MILDLLLVQNINRWDTCFLLDGGSLSKCKTKFMSEMTNIYACLLTQKEILSITCKQVTKLASFISQTSITLNCEGYYIKQKRDFWGK